MRWLNVVLRIILYFLPFGIQYSVLYVWGTHDKQFELRFVRRNRSVDWLLGWLNDWFIHWSIDLLIDLLIGQLYDWMVDWSVDFMDWLVDRFVGRFVLLFYKLLDRSIDWLVGWSIGRSIDWFLIYCWLFLSILFPIIDGLSVYRLVGCLIDRLVDLLILWLIDHVTIWFVHRLIDRSIDWPIDCITFWLIDWMIDWMINWSISRFNSIQFYFGFRWPVGRSIDLLVVRSIISPDPDYYRETKLELYFWQMLNGMVPCGFCCVTTSSHSTSETRSQFVC
jgi:hypothetical protein